MEKFSYKLKFTILWLLGAAAFVVYRTIAINQKAADASLLQKDELIYYLGILILFALLSLILKGNANRKTNIIAGICIGVVQMIVFIDGIVGYPSAMFNLITVFSILIMGLIVWFAYRWPKEKL